MTVFSVVFSKVITEAIPDIFPVAILGTISGVIPDVFPVAIFGAISGAIPEVVSKVTSDESPNNISEIYSISLMSCSYHLLLTVEIMYPNTPATSPTTVVPNAMIRLSDSAWVSPSASPSSAGPIGMSVPISPNMGAALATNLVRSSFFVIVVSQSCINFSVLICMNFLLWNSP